ncbi:MAG TPA: hypothetical protein VMW24_05050 [Sedimentisphaerales bacterium]|nr:hypothetical protein [Sedimentisphaerales bacterium]
MTQLLKSYCTVILCLWCVGENCTAEVVTNTKMSPPLAGGVIAIWLNDPKLDTEAILKLPMIKGGQVMVQWGEVEVAKGKYDFSVFDSRIAEQAKRKLPVTIQLNGNRKPHYIFNEVPYVKETGREVPAFKQVQNREGTLMYWHPTHEKAYIACLTAFRDHVASSPYKPLIIGLRMNFNPFGTETIHIYPQEKADEYAPKERWIKPPGIDASIPYKGFDLPEGLNYVRRIMRKHIELFDGVVPMFIRCTVNNEVLQEFSEYLDKGTFGIFETGSAFVPWGTRGEDEEEWILRYCKPGKTIGYAESLADAWGRTGGPDQFLCSPPQANYWRVLCDLHKGVSYLAFYGRDLNVAVTGTYQLSSWGAGRRGAPIQYSDSQSGFNYRQEFYEALVFADKYAGYHASPEQAPGAWIAMRESDAVADARNRRQKLKVFNNDYTYLMDRLPDKSTGVMKIGPDQIRYGAYARRLPPKDLMRLKVNDRFLQSLKGTCRLNVIYFDDAPGAGFAVSASGQTWKVPMRGTKAWQTTSFDVSSPAFTSGADGAQIVIHNSDNPVCLHMVEIERR